MIITKNGKKYKLVPIDDKEFIEIPKLKIKVSKEVKMMTYVEAEEYVKENNARMLTVLEAGYIYDNNLIKDFCKQREWLEHYSKKTRKEGFGCSALNGRYWSDDGLNVDGYSWDGSDNGHAFGVRLVYPMNNKAHSGRKK